MAKRRSEQLKKNKFFLKLFLQSFKKQNILTLLSQVFYDLYTILSFDRI